MDVFIAYHSNVLIYFHLFYLCIIQICCHLLVSMGIFISGFSKTSESTDYPDPYVKSYIQHLHINHAHLLVQFIYIAVLEIEP